MFKEMYENGYLNISNIVLDNHQELQISLNESFILIKMLEIFKDKKNFTTKEVVDITNFELTTVQESLNHLMDLGIYEIFINFIKGKGEENYSFNPLFSKLEIILSKSKKNSDHTQLEKAINMLEEKLCRNLTPMELNMIATWFNDDKYTAESITRAINYCDEHSTLTFRNLEKRLINDSKINVRVNDGVLSDEDNKAIDELLQMVNKR